MKKTIFSLTVIVFMAGTILSSCQSSAKKVENAEDKLQNAKNETKEAQSELNKVRNDSITEYQQFKKESEERIIANDKSIAEFKAKLASMKKESRSDYEKVIAGLEQKNSDLKKKLENFKDEGQENWKSFKNEFNHDMDELGEALKNLTVKNEN
jgi:predicted RNase H-like nuclease (RuvC/YqgF family)